MNCTGKEWDTCREEKLGCDGCYYASSLSERMSKMEIKAYLHRTKKKNFEVCEPVTVDFDLAKLPDDKKMDLDYINKRLHDDLVKKALSTKSVQKYGTGYISFVHPQYEGPDEENGNDDLYFDNHDMIFKLRHPKEEPSEKEKLADTVQDLLNKTKEEETQNE